MSDAHDLDDAGALADALTRAFRGSGDDTWLLIRPNLYAVPCAGGYLLYAPLHGLVLLVRGGGVARLLLEPDRPVAECLGGCELEGDTELLQRFDEAPVVQPVRFADKGWDFRPTQLMLSLTAACQLACDYCYIRGGDNPRNMPWEVVEAAIRFVAANAKARGEPSINIQFHGQGEPTSAWRLFQDSVKFAEMQADACGLDVSFSVISNGVLTKEKVQFLHAHHFSVGLSLDGPKAANDAQRPMRSGRSSYDRVIASMRMLREAGVSLSIRSTVTSRNVADMTDFVTIMKTDAGCEQIDFEPLCGAGRASDRDAEVQSILPSFVKNFQKAQTEGLRLGVDVSYSTARIDNVRTSFCGAYGANLNFCVSTEGLVSSCYEVLEAEDPRAELFVYGRFDRQTRNFILDPQQMRRLVELDVTSMGRCRDCFLKWNCGGDCISKAALSGIDNVVGEAPLERCGPSRHIARDVLLKKIAIGN